MKTKQKRTTITIIEDKLLEPYFISKDDYCFTINQRVKPKKEHFKTNGDGKKYNKKIGYYPTLNQALVKIYNEKIFNSNNNDKLDLNKIIDKLEYLQTEVKNYIDGKN